MSDVFVSHVEEDSADALRIADALEAAGYSTWCYERDSIPGPSYLVQTGDAVEQSRAVVVLISRHSLGSRQVTVEVVRGHETRKPFIPVLVGISHVEFTNRQPEWREAMGAATSIMVPREGVAAIVPRILAGLRALGVEPSGELAEHRVAIAAPSRRRAPLEALRRLPAWQRAGLVVAAVALLALAGVLTVSLQSSDEPGTTPAAPTATMPGGSVGPPTVPYPTELAPATPTSTADPADTPLRTIVGEAKIADVRLSDEFCLPAGLGGCSHPAQNLYLELTLEGWGGGSVTIGLTMESNNSYISYDGHRYNPLTLSYESNGVVHLVYGGVPATVGGHDAVLVWPDGQGFRLRVPEFTSTPK